MQTVSLSNKRPSAKVPRLRLFALGLGLAVLAGCAGPSESPARMSRMKPFTPTDHEAAASVLRAGFGEISEKAIVEPALDRLFLAGYRDYWHFDPTLSFGADADRLTLVGAGGEIIASLDRPAPQNLKGWVDVTIQLFESARYSSNVARYADAESLYAVMFDAALAQIDKYSRYSGRRAARTNREIRNGFVGLGFTFDIMSDGIVVRSVSENGPVAEAGINPGDVILAIDGQSTAGLGRDGIQKLVSGPPQTVVRLSLRRAGDDSVASAEARRGLIILHTVHASATGGIGRIEISAFNLRTATDVAEAVKRLKEDGVAGLVLDLRNDPGGLLDQGVEVADLFLDGGAIASLSGRHPGAKQFYEARPGDIAGGLPIIVLIDGKSASAAEILAAALSDNGRAVTVGTTSLGKGSVQTLIRLPNDGELALTWSHSWSPNGYLIQGLGVLPAVCTSGFSGPLADAAAGVFRDRAETATGREAWRHADAPGSDRATLRDLCPAESRAHRDVDHLIAERLLADRAFYAKAVGTSVAASP